MKIALIGTGYWGPNIARNLLALKQEITIYDINKSNLERTLQQYSNCIRADSLEDVLNNTRIEAVAIAVPLIGHSALIIQSLKAGKHVFVEKSLCYSLDEAEAIKPLLGDRILMVGHITLFTGSTFKIKEFIEEKHIGNLTGIYSTRTHLGKIYPGIDAATEVSSHDISLFLYLLNEMPVSVSAYGASRLGLGEPDNVCIILRFRQNLTCTINVQWSSIIRERKIVVEGNSGSLVCIRDREKEELTFYDQRAAFKALRNGAYPSDATKLVRTQVLFNSNREPLYDELGAFLECIENSKQPLTDFFFGRKVVKVLESIRMSMCQNGKTVKIFE